MESLVLLSVVVVVICQVAAVPATQSLDDLWKTVSQSADGTCSMETMKEAYSCTQKLNKEVSNGTVSSCNASMKVEVCLAKLPIEDCAKTYDKLKWGMDKIFSCQDVCTKTMIDKILDHSRNTAMNIGLHLHDLDLVNSEFDILNKELQQYLPFCKGIVDRIQNRFQKELN